MLIPSHLQLEPSNSRTRVPAGGINLIASIDFESDESTTATLSSSTKVLKGEDAISRAQVATPNHSNQQYSIYAITDAAANIVERYAYTAYGQPTILNAAATVIASSAISNRYTYTAREWDATVGLYHFRARWMSGLTGRFLSRDPIGFAGGKHLYQLYIGFSLTDPSGLAACRGLEHRQGLSLITVPTKAAVPGMGWKDGNLQDPTNPDTIGYGKTSPTATVGCDCTECCGKWYFGEVSVDLEFEITIDLNQHQKDGYQWEYVDEDTTTVEGTYGHEQRHVLAGISAAEVWEANSGIDFDSSFGEGAFGKFVCERECNNLTSRILRELRTIINGALEHGPDLPRGSSKPPLRPMPRKPR